MTTVRAVTAAATHDLRRRVLRTDTPSSDVTYPQDDRHGTVHLGLPDADGRLVGVSTWAIEAWPDEPGVPAARLRGMAVDPERQGTGVGLALVDAGLRWALGEGLALVWATARDGVIGFYGRSGFTVAGDGFIDEATALPHHTVILRLSGEAVDAAGAGTG